MRWRSIALVVWGLGVLCCLPAMARDTHGRAPGGLSGGNCVAFARQMTGIHLDGNAAAWWPHAEGRYDRGHQPSVGAILVFKPYGRMHVGHVAVVSRVVGPREVLVDQANWIPGRVTTAMSVIDASPLNDWTSVKVIEPHSGKHGRENPTFGFIYPRVLPASFGETVIEPQQPARTHEERTLRTAARPADTGEAIAETQKPARHHEERALRAAARPADTGETIAERQKPVRQGTSVLASALPPQDKPPRDTRPEDKPRHAAKETKPVAPGIPGRLAAKEAKPADPGAPGELAAKLAKHHPHKPADAKIAVVF